MPHALDGTCWCLRSDYKPEGFNPSIGPTCRVTAEDKHGMVTIDDPILGSKKGA